MQTINFLFSVVILIMSVVIHEVSHGFAAYKLGDPTAKYSGRLTLNPIKHLDFVGSFLVPLLTYSVGGFIFGWAKPVPYNPYNLKNQKWGPAIVGAAGPLANITVALFFGLLLRFNSSLSFLPASFFEIIASIALINLLLAIFNLIPIPPLDGSKLLFAFLPYHLQGIQQNLERFGFFFLLIFITFFWQLLLPIVFGLFKLLTGVGV
ncbi:MAG: site-2 protease family protein [bacterium]|nr:site-2 protease family protein [bacterium]